MFRCKECKKSFETLAVKTNTAIVRNLRPYVTWACPYCKSEKYHWLEDEMIEVTNE